MTTELPKYHHLLGGQPIPSEGLPVVVTGRTSSLQGRLIAYSHKKGKPYLVRHATDGTFHWHKSIQLKPRTAPLSFDTYHGEPLRWSNGEHATVPIAWDENGVTLPDGEMIPWNILCVARERLVNGEWKPCYRVIDRDMECPDAEIEIKIDV